MQVKYTCVTQIEKAQSSRWHPLVYMSNVVYHSAKSVHSLEHDSVQQKEAQTCLTPDADHACIMLHQAEAFNHIAAEDWNPSSSSKETNSSRSRGAMHKVRKDSLGVRACVGEAVEDAAAAAEAVGELSNHDIQLLVL